MENVNEIHMVGCGGIASWVITAMIKSPHLIQDTPIHFWDADTVEEKNLDRQFFSQRDIGKNKAKSFSKMIPGSISHPEFFTARSQVATNSLILVCADNNGARKHALDVCDMRACTAIIGANETIDAEAYVYKNTWVESKRDPRVYYPILLEHDEFDPTAPQCTSAEKLAYTPQLAIANMLAGSYMMFLFNLWLRELPGRSVEASETAPYKINSTYGKIFQTRLEVE